MSQYPKLTDPVSGKDAPVFLHMLCASTQSPVLVMVGPEEARPGNEHELTDRLDADARGLLDVLRTKTPGDTMFFLVRRFLIAWANDDFSGSPPTGDNLDAFEKVISFIENRFDYIPR